MPQVGSSRDQTMVNTSSVQRGHWTSGIGIKLIFTIKGAYPSSMGASLERSHSVRGHPHYRPLIPNTQSEGMASQLPRLSPSPRTIRRIPEEDECWICHNELPSRNLTDFQAIRDRHVQACLTAALGGFSMSPGPTSTTPPPAQQGQSQDAASSQAGPSTSSAPAQAPSTPESRAAAREQAHAAIVLGQNRPISGARLYGGPILPYKASEKDMVENAECTICFEEFEVGQDMARLQCLCRFHLHCIKDWYNKMPGRCPLHDHDRGY